MLDLLPVPVKSAGHVELRAVVQVVALHALLLGFGQRQTNFFAELVERLRGTAVLFHGHVSRPGPWQFSQPT